MRKTILLLPLLLLAVVVQAEQALTVVPLSGTEKQYAVAQIGKVRFAEKVMYLFDKTGAELGHTAVAEIGKIVFEESTPTTSIGEVATTRVSIYPNPTQDKLIIEGLSAGQTVRVYSLSGELMQTHAPLTPSNLEGEFHAAELQLPVSDLPQGAYLLQVGAEIVKFIKQ